jgi:Tol biopolymer transport system component/DNA-binding winged helix-turn-helix (wHTH) protein
VESLKQAQNGLHFLLKAFLKGFMKAERERTKHFYEFGDFCLDINRRVLLRRQDGDPVPLTPKAFETLLMLVRRSGRIVEKKELLEAIWPDTFVEEATLAQNVFTLRKALGHGRPDHQYIETVPKYGYRFVADVRELRGEGPNGLSEQRTRAAFITDELEATSPLAEEGERATSSREGSAQEETAQTVSVDQTATALPEAPAEGRPERLSFRALTGFAKHHRLATAAALFLVTALLAATSIVFINLRTANKAGAPFERMRISMLTTNGQTMRSAISPDGKYLVYVVKDGVQEGLWLRQVSAPGNIPVVAPADVHYQGITFSPDSNSIYYVVYEKNAPVATLYQVSALGGTPSKVLVDIDSPAAFSSDGKSIAFVRNAPDDKEGSLIVAKTDGTAERKLATRFAPDYFSVEGPAWSPDDKRIACTVGRTEFNRTTMAVAEIRVEDGASKLLTARAWDFIGQLAWPADGRAILMDAWDSKASLFSRQIWQLSLSDGQARRVTNDLNSYHGVSVAATNDALVTIRSGRATGFWVAAVEDIGRAARITSGAGDLVGEVMGLAWMPDGRLVYGSNASGNLNIWIMGPDGRHQRQLTISSQIDVKPAVSPDGRVIVFVSWRTGTSHLWRMDADGANIKQLTNGEAETYPHISPDGRFVVYLSAGQNRSSLWRIPIEGGEAVELRDGWSMFPQVSPDGKLVACFYQDEPSIGNKLALIPFVGGEPVQLFDLPSTVFIRAGLRWTADGRALTYVDNRDGVSNIWSLPVDGGPAKRLTDFTSDKIFRFAWSRDGKQLAFERGMEINDATLIGDFR